MHLFSSTTLNDLRDAVAANRPKSTDWQRLIARVDAWCLASAEIPTQSGGWIHNYICPTHWLPLIYDGEKPQEHRCPAGHCVEGAAYDEAWLAWRHRQFADMAREVAIAFAVTGEATYLAEVERVLLAYSAFYANFEGADSAESWMITARVFNQALTEALWAVPLIHAYDLVSAELPSSRQQQIETDFLRPLAETMAQAQDALIEKDHIESNYMAWFNAVLGCLGYVLQDGALVTRALDGAGGFVKHLDAGVLADGMQYEVTPYYHNFVVLAYQILAEAANANGRDLYAIRGAQGQTLQSMWRAIAELTLPDGTIADLGDGSYWQDSVYDRELYEVYEIAYAHDAVPEVSAILNNAYQRSGRGRDHWAALLFGIPSLTELNPIDPKSNTIECAIKQLPDAGVAILQSTSQLAAVVPFGAYRGSHSHGDQLSMQVWPFSNDSACILYGLPVRRDWYQQGYAHNGLVIDGVWPETFSQARHAIEGQQIELHAVDAFVADVSRTVRVEPSQLIDTLAISAQTSHQYDWVFHVDGDLTLDGLVPQSCSEAAGASAAAQQILLTERVNGVDSAEFTIIYNDQTYTLHLSGEAPFDLLLGTVPGTSWNPPQRRRVIIGRTTGTAQTYRTTISHV